MISRPLSGQAVELRVHGVTGTPPERMLDDPHPRQVAGDDVGRIFRRSRPVGGAGDGAGRVVEAFHWGRFTAGSPTRALWLLMLPFAIVNMARFTLPLGHHRRRVDKLADLVLRLLGLALTLTLVVTVSYVAMDVVARQCGGSAACRQQNQWLSWFVERSFGVRLLVASLLPAVVLAMVWWFGRQTFQYDPPGPRRDWRTGNGSFDDLMFWRGAASAPVQRAAHVLAGCAVLGAVALGVLGAPGDWLRGHGRGDDAVYLGLFALCALVGLTALVLVVWNPRPRWQAAVPDAQGRDAVALPRWVRWSRSAVAAPLVAVCVGWTAVQLDDQPPDPGQSLPGLEIAANLVAVLTGLLLVLLLVVCAGMAFLTGPGRRLTAPDVPKAFRPYWFGLGAWMLAALAATFASGFSTSLVFWSSRALGRPVLDRGPAARAATPVIELAASYWTGALLWGAVALVGAVLLVPLAAWLLRRRPGLVSAMIATAAAVAAAAGLAYDGADLVSDQAEWLLLAGGLAAGAALLCALSRRSVFLDLVVRDYPGSEAPLQRGRSRVARRWGLAAARYRYHHAVGTLAGLGGLLVMLAAGVAAWRTVVPDGRARPPLLLERVATGPLGTTGVLVVTAIAGGLVMLGLATWRKPAMRAVTGVLWDLLSLWPRLAHPLCPPPYGGRAVLGVAVRASQLVNVLGAERVVLSGHSQGSVVTLAACAVLDHQAHSEGDLPADASALDPASAARTMERLGMVTYGSQLQFIYARLFPTYTGFPRLRWIYRQALGGRWRHLYRWTDPLGGPVLSWPSDEPPRRGAPHGPAVERWTLMSCEQPAGCPGHEPLRVEPAGADGTLSTYWSIGPDVRLRDPDVIVESAWQPRSPLRGHGNYQGDPVFDAVVADLAGQDPAPPPPCPQAPAPAGDPAAASVPTGDPATGPAPTGDAAR